jgi:hypothetical protein
MPSGAISLLGVRSDSALINSEKFTADLNGPHCTELG